jgi:hypothetical protein
MNFDLKENDHFPNIAPLNPTLHFDLQTDGLGSLGVCLIRQRFGDNLVQNHDRSSGQSFFNRLVYLAPQAVSRICHSRICYYYNKQQAKQAYKMICFSSHFAIL